MHLLTKEKEAAQKNINDLDKRRKFMRDIYNFKEEKKRAVFDLKEEKRIREEQTRELINMERLNSSNTVARNRQRILLMK